MAMNASNITHISTFIKGILLDYYDFILYQIWYSIVKLQRGG